ncbi:HAD-IIB family hydrolase [Nanchangia anserum]|uniref:phosphomannomutase n=1 Tax=Nanchangia anserum TaxID=2692125 RepID=A0A8I0G9U6_9ACTO|nr:HAD-IIB family hydrolase [Nanchangia anserum]MBD3688858.1 HAD-IIB family hydrolase [Nanchangia anserum]QOX81130.1 HAD-IIB family hydrolase [Nanchangia anserum]
MLPALVAFDLDDTLTASKATIDPEMAALFADLAERTQVAIISGGMLSQFQRQVLDHVSLSERAREHLHLLPTCGTRYVRWRGDRWQELRAVSLTPDQVEAACAAIERRAREQGIWEDETWGPAIENRGSQITYSALGQSAPGERKAAWDPDGGKRARLARAVGADLPELSVRSGGATSVDITLAGIDKAYGMRHLLADAGLDPDDVVFFGDRLDPDGNDYPVLSTGVTCREVTNPADTAAQLRALLGVAGSQ